MMRDIKIRTRVPAMNFKLFSVQNLQPHFEVVFLRRIRMICGAHILSNFREPISQKRDRISGFKWKLLCQEQKLPPTKRVLTRTTPRDEYQFNIYANIWMINNPFLQELVLLCTHQTARQTGSCYEMATPIVGF